MTTTFARRFGRFGWMALGASLCLASSDVRAQTADPDPVQLFDEGNAFYREGNFAAAEAKFQQSFDLKPVFDVAANLGDCEIEIGQHRDAAEHLAYAVKNFPVTGGADVRAQLESRLREALTKVGALTIQPNVPGAAIAVDGTKIGESPLDHDIYVEPGAHTISATKDGYERASAEITATAGEKQAVGLTLKLLKEDGAGGGSGEEEGSGAYPWVVGIGTGLALAGIGAGVGLLVAGGGKKDDAAALEEASTASGGCAGPCPDVASAYADADTLYNASAGVFVAGGVIGLATLVYAIAAMPGDDDSTAGLPLPVVGPGYAGLVLNHSF